MDDAPDAEMIGSLEKPALPQHNPAANNTQSLAIDLSDAQRMKHKSPGPRTELGKRIASRDAMKHGIFSNVVVLKGESKAGYKSLLMGLQEDRHPEGALEGLLVEKLATIIWRQRRLHLAEGAEIRKGRESFVWAKNSRPGETIANALNGLSKYHSFISRIGDLNVLERCLEMLEQLKEELENRGFDPERDGPILEEIYGERVEDRYQEDLYSSYITWCDTAVAPAEEREREGYSSPEKCKEIMLEEIKQEIIRLKDYQNKQAPSEALRTQLEIQSRSIPDTPELDRLLRYEASLERSFDRTLSQLERAQRMRLGHPVPPRIDVDVRHSCE
jgi:hypothetical protein